MIKLKGLIEENKKYMNDKLKPILEPLVSQAVAELPEDPVSFMLGWLRKKKESGSVIVGAENVKRSIRICIRMKRKSNLRAAKMRYKNANIGRMKKPTKSMIILFPRKRSLIFREDPSALKLMEIGIKKLILRLESYQNLKNKSRSKELN